MPSSFDSSSTQPTAFSSLSLPPAFQANLEELGYTAMTPVQAATLPATLAGRDVIAQAKTGSGKTAAFGIPALVRLLPKRFCVQTLVLCPTRELADQVAQELRRLARGVGNVKILTLCGGAPLGPQIGSLEHGAHIVVGTPGRIQKLIDKAALGLDQLQMLVLDEADRMLDMGFYESINAIVSRLPNGRQTLLFSATYPSGIRDLSKRFQRAALAVTVESLHEEADIRQLFFEIDEAERATAARALLSHHAPASALLFCNTKQRCENVVQALKAHGFQAAALHGDLEQRERDQVLALFQNLSCPVLVATDVAARGLDVRELAAVINVDLAFDPEVHIHRIGRTGRAGQKGLALSLCAPAEVHRAAAIEKYQERALAWQALPKARTTPPGPPAWVTLEIAGGRKEKVRAGDIVGALTGAAAVEGSAIGKIAVFDRHTYVAVDRAVADAALQRIATAGIKGRKLRVRKISR